MHPLAEKYLRKRALPFIFCPGCGHGTVLNAFLRAVDSLGIIDDLSLVGGIGCSSWAPVFVETDVLHMLHGRALAAATGLKLADPKRHVVVFTGDGDCVGIGGNHFLHAARRNIDLTVIMLDNGIYGMTGGQAAPTTPSDAKTQTSPYGNLEPPMDACAIAVCAGATYVARWTSAHPKGLETAIREAIAHKGFSFLDVVSQCPTQAGRYIYGTANPAEMLRMIKKRSITRSKAEKMSPESLEDKIVIGKLHEENGRPELSERIYAMMDKAAVL
ncbi:MAG: 2-oxoacid:ferredoxin oxidoreductase subunit beta [Desulfobacteraceae bacterium]|nr:MAG: 2-oxoacid:ferredoxin oxidoreductase subunit beta [Desulfobacteraceae bacterium]